MCDAARQYVLDLADIPATKKFVAYRVAEIVNPHNDHKFWMNPESLAHEVGIGVGTVRKYLQWMVTTAEMMSVVTQGGGSGKHTCYRFTACKHLHNVVKEDTETAPPGAVYDLLTAPPMPETAPPVPGSPITNVMNPKGTSPQETLIVVEPEWSPSVSQLKRATSAPWDLSEHDIETCLATVRMEGLEGKPAGRRWADLIRWTAGDRDKRGTKPLAASTNGRRAKPGSNGYAPTPNERRDYANVDDTATLLDEYRPAGPTPSAAKQLANIRGKP